MSIDARVVGLRMVKDGKRIVKLSLEDRPGGGPAGQSTLRITNRNRRPGSLVTLKQLIGCDIWGGSGEIMLGDNVLAKRHGYTAIELVDDWEEVIINHLL